MRFALIIIFSLMSLVSVSSQELSMEPSLEAIVASCIQSPVEVTATLTDTNQRLNPSIPIQLFWLSNSLGTLSPATIDTDSTKFHFSFTPNLAEDTGKIGFDFQLFGQTQTVLKEKKVNVTCKPERAWISLHSGTDFCGDDSNVTFRMASCYQINEIDLPQINNLELIGTSGIGTDRVFLTFSRTGCGNLRQQFKFRYKNLACNDWSDETEYIFNYNVNIITPTIRGDLNPCLDNGNIYYYGLQIDNTDSPCVDVQWELVNSNGTPATGASLGSGFNGWGWSVSSIEFTQQGNYILRAYIAGCGTDYPTIATNIEICEGLFTPSPDAPASIANICDMSEYCYTPPSNVCIESWDVTNNTDNKLVFNMGTDGRSLCVSDLLGSFRSRNTTVQVSATNSCGTSITRNWVIRVNPQPYCSNLGNSFRLSESSTTKQASIENELLILPNPAVAGKALQLQIGLLIEQEVSIKLFSTDGRLISQLDKFLTAGTSTLQLNSNGTIPGVYFISMESEGKRMIEKVILR